MKRAFCLCKLQEIFFHSDKWIYFYFSGTGAGYPHKRSGTKKGRSRADRVGTMLSGIRRESTSAEAEKRRGSGGLDPIRSRNNVSRVSNKRLKLNFVECADSPPPLASSPFTPKWILNRAESVRPSIRPKYRRGGSTLGRKWRNGGAERRFFLCFSFSLSLSCVIS